MTTSTYKPGALGRHYVYRGETWTPLFTLQLDSTAIDLTSATILVTLRVRLKGSTGAATTYDTDTSTEGTKVNATAGIVQFFVPDDWTDSADEGEYDIDLEYADSSISPHATHRLHATGVMVLADPPTGTFTAD